MDTKPTHLLLAGVLAVGLLGCGNGDSSAGGRTTTSAPVASTTVATAASTPAGVDGSPAPANRWPLDGDGIAAAGDIEVTSDGGTTWSASGLVLDGATGYAATPEPGPIDTSASFTVMAWVKPDGIAPYATAVSQIGDVAGAFFLGYGESTWQFAVKKADSNEPGVTQRIESGIVDPAPATWVHLAGVYDHDRQWAQLYVNGHPATPDGVDVPNPFAATGALHIGNAKARGKPSDFWSGTIADVRVHTTALDDDEIAEIAEATAPTGATLDAPPPPVTVKCPNPGGGKCLGPLSAGTYTTMVFQPSITYTVPDGWTNGEDLPGNFLLQLDGDNRYLGIYRNVTAPFECEERADPAAGRTVASMTTWLTSHPGLTTTEPQPVTIGGLTGVYLDIGLDPSWTTTCPFSEGQPVVPFIFGDGPSSLEHVILPGFQERLYLLEADGGNVAIEVGPEGTSLPEYLEAASPLIDSLQFTS